MGLFGGSKSTTANTTQNTTNNLANESGVQVSNSAGASIVVTDHDAIEYSLDAVNNTVTRAFDFGDEALDKASSVNEQAVKVNQQALGTVKDFAETLKTGDSQGTKTAYIALAGLALVGGLVLVFAMSNSNKKKVSK